MTETLPAPLDAIALTLPETTPFDEWLAIGRNLAAQHKNMNWLIGDWALHGQTHYGQQFTLALPDISDDPKSVKAIAKVAKAFPPAHRDAGLSFAHHAGVADLPTDEALALLKNARQNRISAKQLKIKASVRKIEIGQTSIWDDKDIDYSELIAIVRAWNCAQPHIREQFVEMSEEANLGIIEA